MEAINFIKNNKNKYCFASNHFDDKNDALKFVNKLYSAGAEEVRVDGILNEQWRIKEEKGAYADTLIIKMPREKEKIINIMAEILIVRPDEVDDLNHPKTDWNKAEYIRLWWD